MKTTHAIAASLVLALAVGRAEPSTWKATTGLGVPVEVTDGVTVEPLAVMKEPVLKSRPAVLVKAEVIAQGESRSVVFAPGHAVPLAQGRLTLERVKATPGAARSLQFRFGYTPPASYISLLS